MTNHTDPPSHERYSPGYGDELINSFRQRRVEAEASFFLPLLKPGMSLIDCGCGPGTITAGLARAVAPGVVHAFDLEPGQVSVAAAHQEELNISNVEFHVAGIYEIPFPDATFDAAFVHAVLQHVQYPLRALEEVHRVLKPGGVIGVRDDDQGSLILAPEDEKMTRVLDLLKKILHEAGGDTTVGRNHRKLLRQAGFDDVFGFASVECDGELRATTKRGDLAAALLTHMTETAVEAEWATRADMEELADACRTWGRDPDAYDAIIWCEAVGRKP